MRSVYELRRDEDLKRSALPEMEASQEVYVSSHLLAVLLFCGFQAAWCNEASVDDGEIAQASYTYHSSMKGNEQNVAQYSKMRVGNLADALQCTLLVLCIYSIYGFAMVILDKDVAILYGVAAVVSCHVMGDGGIHSVTIIVGILFVQKVWR